MVKPTTMVVALKTLMVIMFFAIIGAFLYVIAIGAIIPCYNWTLRWDLLLETQCTVIYVIFFGVVLLQGIRMDQDGDLFFVIQIVGSVVTLPYIFYQFSKLSPEELSSDPIYFVLVKHKKREQEGTTVTSVANARVLFSAVGVLLLGVFIYTVILDIVRFYAEPITPCLFTYMVDIYIYGVLLAVWIVHKESSWTSAFLWILLLLFSGTLAAIVYVVRELFSLPPDLPASHILFNTKDRDLLSNDHPLI